MIKQKLQNTFFLNLGLALFFILHSLLFPAEALNSDISYQTYEQPDSIIHIVTIPHQSNYTIAPVVATQLNPLKSFLTSDKAIAAINGGYFDPNNQQTTSHVLQEGRLVADPRNNLGLIENPNIQAYLGKILNRSEFRSYSCGNYIHYDITLHSDPIPLGCQLQNALGAGPQILPLDTSVQEGFVAYNNGKEIRNAIGTQSRNARSAIAITQDQDILLIMVAQKTTLNSGMSLPELATFLSTLGVKKAMNLDGGSSSSLYYQGQTFYGKLDQEGQSIQRLLKSVLVVKKT